MQITNKEHEYNALVVRHSSGQCFLFYEVTKGVLSTGDPITDSEKIYENFKVSSIGFCKVCFCDGTEPKPIEFFTAENQPFIAIKDLATITLLDDEEKECDAYEALKKNGSLMCDFFEEEIFKQ